MQLTAKWVALFIFVWVIGTWLGWTYDGAASWGGGTTENASTTMTNIMSANVASQRLASVGIVSFLVSAGQFLFSLYMILTWQFSFVKPYPMVQWIFFAFGAMGLVSLFMMLYGMVRGNISWG